MDDVEKALGTLCFYNAYEVSGKFYKIAMTPTMLYVVEY